MLTIGSLFSGIGGIDLGLEKTGQFTTSWFVENNKYCQKILSQHWKEAQIYGDIKTINFDELQRIDILTGGFPCQDISNAGKRAGITGERSGLWKEYLRAISILRPKYAVIENVSALKNRGLETVLSDLASIGYDAEWHCFPASAIGAKHRRDRVFIIAIRTNSEREWGGAEYSIMEKQKARLELTGICSHMANGSGHLHGQIKKQSAEAGKHALCELGAESQNVSNSNIEGLQRINNQEFGSRQSPEKIGCGSDPLSYTYNHDDRIKCKESLREKNRRETWATERGICRVAHGISNRVDRIKALGNAVVPQCAELIGKIILKYEEDAV